MFIDSFVILPAASKPGRSPWEGAQEHDDADRRKEEPRGYGESRSPLAYFRMDHSLKEGVLCMRLFIKPLYSS